MAINRLERLENKPILNSIFILSFPVILGNLATVIYNLTDAYFVGQLQDVAQLAGATFSYPLLMILMSIGEIFGIGGASYLSRCLGAGRKDLAEKTIAKSFVSVFVAGVFIGLFCIVFLDPIIKLLGSSGDAYNYTRSYVFILLCATPIIMMNTISIDMLRAEGAAKFASIGMAIGVLTNLILDPLFIFVFGLEIKGAAIATVIGNFVAFCFSIFVFKYKTLIKIKIKKGFEKSGIFFEIIKVGIPSALNIILMSVAMIITNNIAALYGESVVAGMGLALRNHSIVIQVLLGFSMGAMPLIGYFYGKKDYKKVRKIIYSNMGIITTIGTVLSVIFFIFAEPMISIFNSDPDVIYNGARGLRALLLCKPIIGIFMVSMSSVQAMGKGFTALVFSVTRQLFLFIIATFLLNYYFGYNGFIYGQSISDFIMIIFAGIVITVILRRLNKPENKLEIV